METENDRVGIRLKSNAPVAMVRVRAGEIGTGCARRGWKAGDGDEPGTGDATRTRISAGRGSEVPAAASPAAVSPPAAAAVQPVDHLLHLARKAHAHLHLRLAG
jgi:hypothetical protein